VCFWGGVAAQKHTKVLILLRGYAGRDGTDTLIIVCAAVSGDGVFAACLAMITDTAAI